jgi:hypothetical protein
MESEKLTPPPSDDESFDRWLSAGSPLPSLPDQGFSATVLAQLPARATDPRSNRLLVCLLAAAIGVVLAAAPAVLSPATSVDFTNARHDLVEMSEVLAGPAGGAAMAAIVLSLAFAFRSDLRRWRGRFIGI